MTAGQPKGTTEGQWHRDGHNLPTILRCVRERGHPEARHSCGDYEVVARCEGENWDANSRLIAAAPTILAALLETPAAVRWVSAEPLLGPIVMPESWLCYGYLSTPDRPLDWIVVGKESGPNARWIDDDAVRSICDQCATAGVAFFYKQDVVGGRKVHTPELDGVRHVAMPQVRP